MNAISFALTITGGGASDKARVFIYTVNESTGLPENLVVQSAMMNGPLVSGWNTFLIPTVTLDPGEYWIGASVNLVGNLHGWYSDQPTGGAYSSSSWLTASAPDNLWNQTLGGLGRFSFRAICSGILTPTVTDTPAASYTATPTRSATFTDTPTFTPSFTPTIPTSACPSFGAEVPGTDRGAVTGGTVRFGKYANPTLSTVSGVAFYLSWSGTSSSSSARAYVYSVNGSSGLPEDRLADSGQVLALVQGWNLIPIPPTVLEPGDYWLGAEVSVNGTSYDWYYDQPTGGAVMPPYSTASPLPANLWGMVTEGEPRYTFRAVCSGVLTPTITATPAASFTATPTWTPTFTKTYTPTFTFTSTPPVSACSSFGATGPGTGRGAIGGGSLRFGKYTNSTTSTVSGIAFYLDWTYPPSSNSARAFLYTSNGSTGLPESLVAETGLQSNALVRGWNQFAIPATVLAPGDYWLGANVALSGTNYEWYYDQVSGGAYMPAPPTSDPPPADLTGQVTDGEPRYAFKAVCEVPPAATPTATATP